MSSLLLIPDISLDDSLIASSAMAATATDPLMMSLATAGTSAAAGLGSVNPVSSPADLPCGKCGYNGCDLRIEGCGCSFHTRCCSLPANKQRLTSCPNCHRECLGIFLEPLSFLDMDEARRNMPKQKESKSKRAQNRKRKQLNDAFSNIHELYDRRTGRWAQEEIDYVDELIVTFNQGKLPLMDGVKLNDFLAGLLQCKHSRLTKKMKNARLSSKSYVRSTGCLEDDEAKRFGMLENAFLQTISCAFVRAEVCFHMKKQWREVFSNYCVNADLPIDASQWINSVEELERRSNHVKDYARVQRRKLMMKCALNQDIQNPDPGVFIDKESSDISCDSPSDADAIALSHQRNHSHDTSDDLLMLLSDKALFDTQNSTFDNSNYQLPTVTKEVLHKSSFLAKVMHYIRINKLPFEHADAWVPSYIADTDAQIPTASDNQKCRLCFAGSDTLELDQGREEEYYRLVAFGEYSEKFSFDVGCGMPGRVYQSGIPTWEQSVHNAPFSHFERCGGAMQWEISTAVAIPIPSPNVGRIVLILYSCNDHSKNSPLVNQLCDDFSGYLPSPKWRLVVESAKGTKAETMNGDNTADNFILKPCARKQILKYESEEPAQAKSSKATNTDVACDIIQLLGEHMPSDDSSPGAVHLSGFMTLRLMLLRCSRSAFEEDMVRILKSSYVSYCNAGRQKNDIALLLARDCAFLSQSIQQNPISTAISNESLQVPSLRDENYQDNEQNENEHNTFDLVPIDDLSPVSEL